MGFAKAQTIIVSDYQVPPSLFEGITKTYDDENDLTSYMLLDLSKETGVFYHTENINSKGVKCIFEVNTLTKKDYWFQITLNDCSNKGKYLLHIVPKYNAGELVGTLFVFLISKQGEFSDVVANLELQQTRKLMSERLKINTNQ